MSFEFGKCVIGPIRLTKDGDNAIIKTPKGHDLFILFQDGKLTVSNEAGAKPYFVEALRNGEWLGPTEA